MRSIQALRGTAIVLAGVGAYCIYVGVQLKYYGMLGPGPGFFPIWIGAILVVACAALFVQTLTGGPATAAFFPSPAAARRAFGLMVSLAAAWIGLQFLGYRLAILLFALAIPHILGRQSPVATIAAALVVSFGVAHGFESWLRVQLPEPAFDVLKDIGL